MSLTSRKRTFLKDLDFSIYTYFCESALKKLMRDAKFQMKTQHEKSTVFHNEEAKIYR